MPPQSLWFSCRFDLKTGIDFVHFGLELSVIIEGTTECINIFLVLIATE